MKKISPKPLFLFPFLAAYAAPLTSEPFFLFAYFFIEFRGRNTCFTLEC